MQLFVFNLFHSIATFPLPKETAQLAAAIGREFDYQLLVRSSEQSEEQVQINLDELVAADLILQQRKVSGDTYIFKHALVRDAAYDSMPSQQTIATHQRVANTIAREFPELANEQPFTVAQHYAAATDFVQASEYGIKAIFALNANSFNTEALLTGDIVKDWVIQISELDTNQRSLQNECQLKLNNTLIPINTMINGWANNDIETMASQNNRIIEQLQGVSGNILDQTQLEQIKYKTQWSLFVYHHYRGDRAIARKLGEALYKVTEKQNNRVNKLLVSTTLGQAYFFDGDYKLASNMLRSVIENYDKEADIGLSLQFGFDPYYFSCGNLMSIAAITGDIDLAHQYKDLCLSHALATNNLPTIIIAYTWGTCFYFLTFDRSGMTQWCQQAISQHGEQFNSDWILRFFKMNNEWTTYSYEESALTVAEAIKSGQDGFLSWYDPLLSDTYMNLQMYDDALHIIESSLHRSLHSGDKCMLPILYRHLAVTQCQQAGQITPEAEQNFKHSIAEAESRHCHFLTLLTALEWHKYAATEQQAKLIETMSAALEHIQCSSEQPHLQAAKQLINNNSQKGAHHANIM